MAPPDHDDNLPPDDQNAWADAMRHVKPLDKKGKNENSAAPPPRNPGKIRSRDPAHAPQQPAPPRDSELPKARGTGLDRRSDEKLRKGQMRPEARIDLHGMTQDAARPALIAFLKNAWADGRRCVLVITGKGSSARPRDDSDWTTPPPGILRTRVPEWMAAPPLSDIVLRSHPAQPRDGGSGALYVLLRRRRD